MATWTVTGQKSLIAVFAESFKKVSVNTMIRVVAVLKTLLRLCLVVGALAAFTVAAWMVAVPLGVAVLGMSLLGFEWWVKR